MRVACGAGRSWLWLLAEVSAVNRAPRSWTSCAGLVPGPIMGGPCWRASAAWVREICACGAEWAERVLTALTAALCPFAGHEVVPR